jgi:hypothetical protein
VYRRNIVGKVEGQRQTHSTKVGTEQLIQHTTKLVEVVPSPTPPTMALVEVVLSPTPPTAVNTLPPNQPHKKSR